MDKVEQDGSKLYETKEYRCLVNFERRSKEIYLLLCGVEQCHPHYEFHTRGRQGYHLHVILSGKGVLCVKGEQRELHAGQMFVTKPGEETWYRADGENPWTYCWAAFDGESAKSCIESAGFYEGINSLECHVDQQRFYTLVRDMVELPELTMANNLIRTGKLLEFIGLAVKSRYQVEAEGGVHQERGYSADVYVEYAVNYIQNNYAAIRISDVARYIGIHRSYLTNIFKKKIGLSPQEYLLQCKMNKSCEMLLETQLPIQEIARRVGYENPLTYSKIFKNFYGLSPKQYRLRQPRGPRQES